MPWGLCGVYFTGVLGVATLEYLPFVFLSYLAPLITVLYGFTNKFIWKEGERDSVKTYHDEDKAEMVN